jgi:hypothetical protein
LEESVMGRTNKVNVKKGGRVGNKKGEKRRRDEKG